MLVDVDKDLVGGRAGVPVPYLGLAKLHPVQRLFRQPRAPVGQGLGVGEHAAKGFYPARFTLDVGGSTKMVRRIAHSHADPVACPILGLSPESLEAWPRSDPLPHP